MFSFRAPSGDDVRRLLERQRDLPFPYPGAGMSRQGRGPEGFQAAHHRVRLGTGQAAFDRARAAVRAWTMFRMDWVRLYWPTAPIETGTAVAMAAHTMGFWTVNASRIVYTLDERGSVEIFGFACGTLPHHVERGEERFSVQWDHADDSVWYDLWSFSRPGHLLVRLGEPLARRLQQRFVAASLEAMARACRTFPGNDLSNRVG